MTKKKFFSFLNEVLSGHGKPPVSKAELDQVLKLYPASENPIENHKTAAEFLGDPENAESLSATGFLQHRYLEYL